VGDKAPNRAERQTELKVFISHRDSVCAECGEELGRGAWIFLAGEKGALCLDCADLDHLAFLPTGDAALTRRAKKHSRLWAVVLKWSRARERYERQGLLVQEKALARAEEECLADEVVRQRRRERDALDREELDQQYVARFAQRIRELFPGCPAGTEQTITQHACRKYSGRVGGTSAARQLDEEAVRLAVVAHARHAQTSYDDLLLQGYDRSDARDRVRDEVSRIMDAWASNEGG
jgi:hypothetical protein